MIRVTNQTEFDSVVSNTQTLFTTSNMILIFPKVDGTPYTLAETWVIPSNFNVRGFRNPVISYTGSYTSSTDKGAIEIKGTATDVASRKKNVLLEGFTLKLDATVTGALSGIHVKFCGFGRTKAGLDSGNASRYDASLLGIHADETMGAQIVDVRVVGFKKHGIYLENISNCTIRNCRVTQCGVSGIQMANCYTTLITDNVVGDNLKSGIGCDSNSPSMSCIISSNEAFNNLEGINLNGDYLVVQGNKARHNVNAGIEISSLRGSTITNNETLQGAKGILLTAGNYSTVYGNTCYHSPLALLNVTNATIACNSAIGGSTTAGLTSSNSTKSVIYSNMVSPKVSGGKGIELLGTGNVNLHLYGNMTSSSAVNKFEGTLSNDVTRNRYL